MTTRSTELFPQEPTHESHEGLSSKDVCPATATDAPREIIDNLERAEETSPDGVIEHPSRHSLDKYLSAALDRNISILEGRTHGDPWRSPAFEFTRAAMAHPALKRYTVNDWPTIWERICAWQETTGRNLCEIGDRCEIEGLEDEDAAEDEIHSCWEAIRYPLGTVPFSAALQNADRERATPRRVGLRTKGYLRFARLNYCFAKLLNDGGRFFLSEADAGKLLHRTPKIIGKWRKQGEKDGWLVELEPARYKEHKSTLFQVRFDEFAGGAE